MKIIAEKGLRMYFFVMYNLSGIQKGIQAGHAAVEYGLKYGDTSLYKDFANHHKTFILLDGGGSNDMIEREHELLNFGIKFAAFKEPDLNYSTSAIAFIVPEEIYGIDSKELKECVGIFFPSSLEYARYLKSFRLASN
jgi:hypothetical protein